MNLDKAERVAFLLDRVSKVQNNSRSNGYQYELDSAIIEIAKQIKIALQEPASNVAEPSALEW